jgi:hypothetical protein
MALTDYLRGISFFILGTFQCFAAYGFSYFDPIDGCGDYSACVACSFTGWV